PCPRRDLPRPRHLQSPSRSPYPIQPIPLPPCGGGSGWGVMSRLRRPTATVVPRPLRGGVGQRSPLPAVFSMQPELELLPDDVRLLRRIQRNPPADLPAGRTLSPRPCRWMRNLPALPADVRPSP